jgi:hypothetical protein
MENKVIDYTVENEVSPDALKGKVNELMKLMNWQPIGGLAVSFAPNQKPVFAQALVRYAKTKLI